MKAVEIAKLAVLAGVGFVAVKIALKARDAVNAGADAATAVRNAVVETVKTDLNPASDKNVVYRGANWVGAHVTNEPNFNLGGEIHDGVSALFGLFGRLGARFKSSDVSNTQKQTELMGLGPNPHVAANWDAMAAQDAAVLKQTEEKMSNKRSAFRAAEIQQQNEAARPGFLN